MTLEQYQSIAFILALVIVVWVAIYLYIWIEKKESKGIPDLKNIPPAPIQRYTRIPSTNETQYGRDLLEISTKIYIEYPGEGVVRSVENADELIARVNSKCSDIDKQKQEEAEERNRELTKEVKWQPSERFKEQVRRW